MDEELKNKNETNEEVNNGNNILNDASRKGTFSEQVKQRRKSGISKKILKKIIKKSIAIALLVVIPIYIVCQPLFTIYDTIKNLTLNNMGQTLPNADSSTYSTTTGIFGKIAGKIVSGINALLSAIRSGF